MVVCSAAAVQDILTLGSQALQAIGAGSRAERLKKDVDRLTQEVLAARGGHGSRALMRQLGDAMRNLSVAVASETDGSSEVPLGALFVTVNGVISAAASRVMSSSREESQAATEILAVAAQTAGRIVTLGGLYAADAMSVADVASTLRSIMSASSDVRVVESAMRALEALIRAGSSRAVYDVAAGGLLGTMLATLEQARAVFEAMETESAYGAASKTYDATKHSNANKTISLIRASLRLITSVTRTSIGDFVYDGGSCDINVLAELVLASSVSSARTAGLIGVDVDEGDLRDTIDAFVVAPGGLEAMWSILETFLTPEFQASHPSVQVCAALSPLLYTFLVVSLYVICLDSPATYVACMHVSIVWEDQGKTSQNAHTTYILYTEGFVCIYLLEL